MDGLPTFFVLGAMKCGTTSLYRYLEQHPDVYFSEPKEPVFFEAQYERGLDFYKAQYFSGWAGERAVGEARTHHLFLPFVPARLREHFPNARLIAILRDPVERAYSHWWHRTTWGLETLPFAEALEENRSRQRAGEDFSGAEGEERWRRGRPDETTARVRHRLYLDLGHYAEQISRFYEFFPRTQFRVVFFEDLSTRPEGVTRELWEFLGVDASMEIDTAQVHNPAGSRVRSPLAQRMLHMRGRDLARRLLPESLRDPLRRFMAGREATRPPLDAGVEAELLDYYAPHNRALEALLGRALPSWYAPAGTRRSSIAQ